MKWDRPICEKKIKLTMESYTHDRCTIKIYHSVVRKIRVTASLNRFRLNIFTFSKNIESIVELLKYWWAFMSKSIGSENGFDSSSFSRYSDHLDRKHARENSTTM
ncbi:uncharacterized protein LOC113320909 [Papaver somniferum]|uniref:uncharacterized protein LOC113320909 n=1 Tax=Papaver somniferum TaxID=3469 RepID=UPI000E6FB6FE|nr:uncharacterized protein LOC113320909 [Papaver somniferum]